MHGKGAQLPLTYRAVPTACFVSLQILDATSGAAYTSIEPPDGADINDVCLWPGVGVWWLWGGGHIDVWGFRSR